MCVCEREIERERERCNEYDKVYDMGVFERNSESWSTAFTTQLVYDRIVCITDNIMASTQRTIGYHTIRS